MRSVLVWDWPTRTFHWCLVLCFTLAWLTAGNDEWLAVHVFAGYVVGVLLVFRLAWGFGGTYYARFASFAYGPRAGWRYLLQVLAGRAPRHVGHNPSGALAIYVLLALLLGITATGVLTWGGEERHGPMAGWLDFAAAGVLKQWHEALAMAALALVSGHVVGVLMESRLHHENLTRAMLSGYKLAEAPVPEVAANGRVGAALLALLLAFALWWFVLDWRSPYISNTGVAYPADVRVPVVGPSLVQNAVWQNECGSCHLSYHPSLLPRRSWQRLLSEQAQHFGSDLALDRPTLTALTAYALAHAAEQHATEAAYKIERSVPAASAPIRISDTPYWQRKHRDITPAQWQLPWIKSKANCAACHLDALAATFEDAAMHVPDTAPQAR